MTVDEMIGSARPVTIDTQTTGPFEEPHYFSPSAGGFSGSSVQAYRTASPLSDYQKKRPTTIDSPSASEESINVGRWSEEEHALFLEGYNRYGKNWKNIAGHVKTRSHVQIRTHAQKFFQKAQRSGAQAIQSSDSVQGPDIFGKHKRKIAETTSLGSLQQHQAKRSASLPKVQTTLSEESEREEIERNERRDAFLYGQPERLKADSPRPMCDNQISESDFEPTLVKDEFEAAHDMMQNFEDGHLSRQPSHIPSFDPPAYPMYQASCHPMGEPGDFDIHHRESNFREEFMYWMNNDTSKPCDLNNTHMNHRTRGESNVNHYHNHLTMIRMGDNDLDEMDFDIDSLE